jgi:hypothetical protein
VFLFIYCNKIACDGRNSINVHLKSGPKNTDQPANSNRVEPNLLFAQQISMICCFGDGDHGARGGNFEIILIKKGYMGRADALHLGNKSDFRFSGVKSADARQPEGYFLDC